MAEPALVLGAAPGPQLHLHRRGAAIRRVVVTGGDGVRRDVALGLPDGDAVAASPAYVGAVVGRYANRIAHGRLDIDGRTVRLPVNDRGHHLHGGPAGFHTRAWDVLDRDDDAVTLGLHSPDGDAGYPGALDVRARYAVRGPMVTLELTATTTAPTVVNLTSHAYWNLAGVQGPDGAGPIGDHLVRVAAARFTPVDETSIPLDGHAPVDGTPFDLRTATPLAAVMDDPHPQVAAASGLDHHLVLDGTGWRHAATLAAPSTRTRMDLWTDRLGLQVYTGNFLDGTEHDVAGHPIRRRTGVALEPQLAPDTPHHPPSPDWPSAVLEPGQTYRSRIGWLFAPLEP